MANVKLSYDEMDAAAKDLDAGREEITQKLQGMHEDRLSRHKL